MTGTYRQHYGLLHATIPVGDIGWLAVTFGFEAGRTTTNVCTAYGS
jgi:hypothetical protein